jgi:hypothetical protein
LSATACRERSSRLIRFAIVATALVLASHPGTSRAQDGKSQDFKTRFDLAKERVGKGYFKEFYAVEGVKRPEDSAKYGSRLVLGIVRPDPKKLTDDWGKQLLEELREDPEKGRARLTGMLKEEREGLDLIARDGTPVAGFLEIGTWGGEPAVLMRRFDTFYKYHWGSEAKGKDFDRLRSSLLDEGSLQDIWRIWETRKAAPTLVGDPQFLIGRGEIVMADPSRVVDRSAPQSDEWADYLRTCLEDYLPTALDNLASYAMEALEARHGPALAKLPFPEELRPYFERGAMFIERNDDRPRKERFRRWRDGLLRYLEAGPTTDAAKAVAKAIRSSELEVKLVPALVHAERIVAKDKEVVLDACRNFPSLAGNLVRRGWEKLHASERDADVLAAKHMLSFLETKRVPDSLGAADPIQARKSALARDPKALAEALRSERAVRTGGLEARLGALVEERSGAGSDRARER